MKILLLGGTFEAVRIAQTLAEHHQVIYSLAGKTDSPELPKNCVIRSKGFGGLAGLVDHIQQEQYGRVVDATHPFAQQISANALLACVQCGVAYHPFQRGAWQPQSGDDWHRIDSMETLIAMLDQHFPTALVTLGQRGLEPFAALQKTRLVLRMIHAPAAPHFLLSATCRHTILRHRPPYEFDFESELIEKYRCACLVTRNSGGKRPAKLDAYAANGLPVLMLQDVKAAENPAPPIATFVQMLLS